MLKKARDLTMHYIMQDNKKQLYKNNFLIVI